jgi:hypothetical protein
MFTTLAMKVKIDRALRASEKIGDTFPPWILHMYE